MKGRTLEGVNVEQEDEEEEEGGEKKVRQTHVVVLLASDDVYMRQVASVTKKHPWFYLKGGEM